MNNQRHTYSNFISRHALVGFVVMVFLSAFVPSCTHDPFSPLDPDPTDTTGNPIDTTGNPIDTTQDTVIIPCNTDLVYFEQQILPILVSNCAKSGCHDAISHEEDIILDSYEHVVHGEEKIIKPFNLNGSKLYEAITENDSDDVMPPPPNQRLSGAQIALISKWILQGAKDTSCTEVVVTCNTVGMKYSTFVAPLLSTYCVGCHSGGAPSGGISLNTYAGVKTVAMSGKLVGAISWAAGYQPMPKGGAKLSDCNIEKIKAWVNDGAPNN